MKLEEEEEEQSNMAMTSLLLRLEAGVTLCLTQSSGSASFHTNTVKKRKKIQEI